MKQLADDLRAVAVELAHDAGNVEKTVADAFSALAERIDARLASDQSEQTPEGAAEAAPQ